MRGHIGYLVAVAVCLISFQEASAQTKVACNGDKFKISCKSPHVIKVINGVWGRSNPYHCKKGNYKIKTRCAFHQRSIKAVQKLCDGKSKCKFTVSTAKFGNPCPPGVSMFMHMDYRCIKGQTTKGCNVKADIYFMIDTSGSVRSYNFKYLLRFINALISSLSIGQNAVRVGVIRFSSSVKIMFPLNRYYAAASLRRAVLSVRFTGRRTATSLALGTMRTKGFTAKKGSRKGVPKIGILITDGVPNSVGRTLRQAARCKKAGIELFCVAAQAPSRARRVIQQIASKKKSDHSFIVNKFRQMTRKAPQIAQTICKRLVKMQPTTTTVKAKPLTTSTTTTTTTTTKAPQTTTTTTAKKSTSATTGFE